MTDPETPPADTIEERFRIVHDHLDLVDRTLDELADKLETELQAVLDETTVDVTYDLNTGSFQAALSIEHIVGRLNERLEPPLFARVVDDSKQIQIGDIRRLYAIDPETLTIEQHSPTADTGSGQADQCSQIKDVIRQLQQKADHRRGVHESAVIELLTYAGYSQEAIEDSLQRLRDRGEIYSPDRNHIRLV